MAPIKKKKKVTQVVNDSYHWNPSTPPASPPPVPFPLDSFVYQSPYIENPWGQSIKKYNNFLKTDTVKPKKVKGPMDRNKIYNKPLLEAFPFLKNKEQEGEIGLEIECEGMNLFTAPISWWGTNTDHSLRQYKGHDPIEYVLRKPIPRKDVPKALTYLSKKLKEVGSDVVDSHRTSVHVHVNCQKLTFKEVTQFWGLYAIFEELLVEFSGPDRKGNLFCLRAKDAEHFIQVYEAGLQQEDYDEIFSKDLRYTACNMSSVSKFGSLEFRSMRGTVDQELIQLWIDILLLIRDKALEYKNPQDIVKDFEKYGPELFLKKTTASRPDIYGLLQGFTDYKKKMWDGMRLMRDVAYAIQWEERDESLVEKKEKKEKKQDSPPPDTGTLPDISEGIPPEKIKEGVWVIHEVGKFWLVNYNFHMVSLKFCGQPWALKARMAFHVDTVTGKFLEAKYVLAGSKPEPDHQYKLEDEEPDFEVETSNYDEDDDNGF